MTALYGGSIGGRGESQNGMVQEAMGLRSFGIVLFHFELVFWLTVGACCSGCVRADGVTEEIDGDKWGVKWEPLNGGQ